MEPLEAFEKYAVSLYNAFGDLKVVRRVLDLLFECCANNMVLLGLGHVDFLDVVNWCFADAAMERAGPAAVARALLLHHLSVGDLGKAALARERVLREAPGLLMEAYRGKALICIISPMARAVATFLSGSTEANLWLRAVLEDGNFVAYSHVAAMWLKSSKEVPCCVSIWDGIFKIISSPNTEDRRVCMQVLLPAAVAASNKDEAAGFISSLISILLEGQGIAEVSDALSLAVSFSQILLDYWNLTHPNKRGDEIGWQVISTGLRFGSKEHSSLRKQARFLLQTAVGAAVANSGVEIWLCSMGINTKALTGAWCSFWDLFEALEEHSPHLLSAAWEPSVKQILSFFNGSGRSLRHSGNSSQQPIYLLSPGWFELLSRRALDHDNDSVRKFILEQLLRLDQESLSLSDCFVLREMLPSLSHNVDVLYPKSDEQQTFEKKVSAFFTAYVNSHAKRRPSLVARDLLNTMLSMRALHFTALRVVLDALLEADASGAFTVAEAMDILAQVCQDLLPRMPLSMRPMLAHRVIEVLACLSGSLKDSSESTSIAQAVTKAVVAAASIPDSLYRDLQKVLATFCFKALAGCQGISQLELLQAMLRGLVADTREATSEVHGAIFDLAQQTLPLEAIELMLGVLRIFKAWHEVQDCPSPFSCHVWPDLSRSMQSMEELSSFPERSAVCALFCLGYSAIMLSDCKQVLHKHHAINRQVWRFVKNRAMSALREVETIKEEIPWFWLHSFVLEHLVDLHTSFQEDVEDIISLAVEVLQQSPSARLPTEHGSFEEHLLMKVAAVSILGPLAAKASTGKNRFELFLLLWKAALQKPATLVDLRFDIPGNAASLGIWRQNHLRELEDAHRVNHEGFSPVIEWRDAFAVFLVAKWRALASLTRRPGFLSEVTEAQSSCDFSFLRREVAGGSALFSFGLALFLDFETLQPQHAVYWAVVARHLIYPVIFKAGEPEDDQRTCLKTLCLWISGMIKQSVGSNSIHVPAECLAELMASLCDSQLLAAEARLFPSESFFAKPVTDAIAGLLKLGEAAVGLSRSITVPLLVTLLKPPIDDVARQLVTLEYVTELFVAMLLHKEATIVDGARCSAPDVASSAIDTSGPAGHYALAQLIPDHCNVLPKFGSTQGLTRIVTLTALDEHARREGDRASPLLSSLLSALFAALDDIRARLKAVSSAKKKDQGHIVKLWSASHRTQLRGWQAVLVLGCRASREVVQQLLPKMFAHLYVQHVPDVRDYQELLACAWCTRFPELTLEEFLLPALLDFSLPPQICSSFLLITSYVFKCIPLDTSQQSFPLKQLLHAVVPYLGHNSAHVRAMAAWAYYHVLEALGVESVTSLCPDFAPLLLELRRFQSQQKDCSKMRAKLHPVFMDFDPIERTALASLTERSVVVPAPASTIGYGTSNVKDSCTMSEPCHFFADADFKPTKIQMDLIKSTVIQTLSEILDRDDVSLHPSHSDEWRACLEASLRTDTRFTRSEFSEDDAASANMSDGPIDLQRKFTPAALPPHQEIEEDASAELALRRIRSPLIVVASLIDKITNLAGLSRTCEIFNASSVCFANARVAKDPTFQAISVSAEKWLPIEEVPVAKLRSYLLHLRDQGYQLIGVEQTHNSVQLGKWTFQSHTALVLGAEKEGIHAELLSILDACVEIPQSGQLRSLNVHVSGSLAIWEYTRQLQVVSS